MNDPSVHVNHDYSSQKREFKEMEVVIDERVFKKDDTPRWEYRWATL